MAYFFVLKLKNRIIGFEPETVSCLTCTRAPCCYHVYFHEIQCIPPNVCTCFLQLTINTPAVCEIENMSILESCTYIDRMYSFRTV